MPTTPFAQFSRVQGPVPPVDEKSIVPVPVHAYWMWNRVVGAIAPSSRVPVPSPAVIRTCAPAGRLAPPRAGSGVVVSSSATTTSQATDEPAVTLRLSGCPV